MSIYKRQLSLLIPNATGRKRHWKVPSVHHVMYTLDGCLSTLLCNRQTQNNGEAIDEYNSPNNLKERTKDEKISRSRQRCIYSDMDWWGTRKSEWIQVRPDGWMDGWMDKYTVAIDAVILFYQVQTLSIHHHSARGLVYSQSYYRSSSVSLITTWMSLRDDIYCISDRTYGIRKQNRWQQTDVGETENKRDWSCSAVYIE